MAADTRLAAVLFGSFLLWLPALTAFLRGDLDAGAVGMRFAGAVAVVWGGIALVTGIVTGYRKEPLAAGEAGGRQPGRRADDPASGAMPDRGGAADEETATSSVSDASGG